MQIGIDIGGSHIAVALVDDNGKIKSKREIDLVNIDYKKIKEKILDIIIKFINDILKEQKIEKNIIKFIGIACPGMVNNGKIVIAVNLQIKDWDISKELQKYFDIPVYLKNDAKCAAICEKEYGSLKEYKDCIFLCIGTGIGGAVFIDDKLISINDNGFEIGHMIINTKGNSCKCGRNGCFETYCSITALKREILKVLNIKEEITGMQLIEIINENNNNERIQKVIDNYIENLSIGISNLEQLFKTKVICIGGSFVYYKDIFMQKLKDKMKNNINLLSNNIEIILAETKNDAGIIGASRMLK